MVVEERACDYARVEVRQNCGPGTELNATIGNLPASTMEAPRCPGAPAGKVLRPSAARLARRAFMWWLLVLASALPVLVELGRASCLYERTRQLAEGQRPRPLPDATAKGPPLIDALADATPFVAPDGLCFQLSGASGTGAVRSASSGWLNHAPSAALASASSSSSLEEESSRACTMSRPIGSLCVARAPSPCYAAACNRVLRCGAKF